MVEGKDVSVVVVAVEEAAEASILIRRLLVDEVEDVVSGKEPAIKPME